MTDRRRIQALAAVVTAVVLLVGGYVVVQAVQARQQLSSTADGPVGAALLGDTPRLVFRNTDQGRGNGLLSTVPLDRTLAGRSEVGPVCDRVDASRERVVCLRTRRGIATTFEAQLLDASGRTLERWPLAGLPSRVRLSPSGRLVADTTFVTGHSYLQVGFSTATHVRRVGGEDYGNLERFGLVLDGRRTAPVDRNVWGVTFGRGDRFFYATVGTGDRTWLVRGDLRDRTLTSVRQNAECPSLSPDGTQVAYKKRTPEGSGHWSLAVLDLSSGRERVLGETRSVDDQVEWLDGSTLLYGLARPGTVGVTDIWRLGTDAGDRPRLAVRNAWSPAVVR